MPGKFVIEIDLRGCMAEQECLRRLMVIEEIASQRSLLRKPEAQDILMARCRILYASHGDGIGDCINVPIEDGAFQPENHGGDTSRHFVWRH